MNKPELIVGYARFDAYGKEITPSGTNIAKSDGEQVYVLPAEALPISGKQTNENIPLTQDLIKQIAMDIGKQVVFHIEEMYPEALKAVAKSAKVSIRNCIHNEIMAAIKVNDEGQIIARLEKRKKFRRHLKGYKSIKTIKELIEHNRKSPL